LGLTRKRVNRILNDARASGSVNGPLPSGLLLKQ